MAKTLPDYDWIKARICYILCKHNKPHYAWILIQVPASLRPKALVVLSQMMCEGQIQTVGDGQMWFRDTSKPFYGMSRRFCYMTILSHIRREEERVRIEVFPFPFEVNNYAANNMCELSSDA